MRVVAVLLLVVVLAGCTQQQFQDVETRFEFPRADEALTVEVFNPDSVTVFRNIDGHPNLALVCIDGVAFVTQSSTYMIPTLRVVELDARCGGTR